MSVIRTKAPESGSTDTPGSEPSGACVIFEASGINAAAGAEPGSAPAGFKLSAPSLLCSKLKPAASPPIASSSPARTLPPLPPPPSARFFDKSGNGGIVVPFMFGAASSVLNARPAPGGAVRSPDAGSISQPVGRRSSTLSGVILAGSMLVISFAKSPPGMFLISSAGKFWRTSGVMAVITLGSKPPRLSFVMPPSAAGGNLSNWSGVKPPTASFGN